MTQLPGQRIVGGPRCVYETVGAGWSTARHVYRRARKVYWNFKYPAEALVEADAEEGLDVLVRRAHSGDTRDELQRELATSARFASGGWFLESVDRLDEDGTPVLVLADPHAERLVPGRPVEEESARGIDRLPPELLELLELLHESDLTTGAFESDDFLVDRTGRWYFLGTDLIAPASAARTPADDLTHWGRLVLSLRQGRGSEEDPLILRARRCQSPDPRSRPSSVKELRDETGSRRGWLGWFRHPR